MYKRVSVVAFFLIVMAFSGCMSYQSLPETGLDPHTSSHEVIRTDPAVNISVKTEKTGYHVSEEKLVFSITNNRDEPWHYGQDFIFEVLEGHAWYSAGKFLGEVPAVENRLNPKHTITGALNFKDYFETIQPGHYRVVINPNYGEWAAAEFDIWVETEGSIVGQWETPVNVIGTEAASSSGDAHYVLVFMDDHTGKEVMIFGEERDERSFTYSITNNEILIQFESDVVWTFPYRLEGDHLILIQNHREGVYRRILKTL